MHNTLDSLQEQMQLNAFLSCEHNKAVCAFGYHCQSVWRVRLPPRCMTPKCHNISKRLAGSVSTQLLSTLARMTPHEDALIVLTHWRICKGYDNQRAG